jgi:mono/diheme cytochrome c family protein
MSCFAPRLLFAAVAILLLPFPGPAAAETPEALYREHCAACHSIGDSEAGVDLLPATSWPRGELREAVDRMQENTGPLTEAQIDALTDLLLDPAVASRLDGGTAPGGEDAPLSLLEGASAEEGSRLFFGQQRFANGGSPCFACHAVGGRGGNLGSDLTTVYARRSESALIAATEKAPFPLMRASYGTRPVTSDEARHLTAFLRDTAASHPEGTTAPRESTTVVFGAAGGLAAALLAATAVLLRSRRAGVRARLVRNSSGGE